MDELEKRIAVAKDYHELTGLGGCIAGLALLVNAATNQPWFWIAGLLLGNLAANAYYRRRYGVVVQKGEESRATRIILIALFVPLAIIGLISIDIGIPLWTPVAWPLVGIALALALSCWRGYPHVGATRWHWAIVGLIAVAGLLPLVGVPVGSRAALVAMGLGIGGIGLVDHLRLVRTLVPVEEP